MGSEALKRNPVVALLNPRPDEPGRVLMRRVRLVLIVSLTFANLIGAGIVIALALLVLPLEDLEGNAEATAVNMIATGAFLLLFIPIWTWWGSKRLREARAWLEEDRPPTEEERKLVFGDRNGSSRSTSSAGGWRRFSSAP